MLHHANDLSGFLLSASDGDLGKVSDFYFDDAHWTIRYIVVDTGKWLNTNKVLISPRAISSVHGSSQRIAVNLTKQRIQDSPSFDSDKPVSRQFEDSYHKYYGWPIYWGGPFAWGPSLTLASSFGDLGYRNQGSQIPSSGGVAPSAVTSQIDQTASEGSESGDPHLRSTNAVGRYAISAQDGPVGHIQNFIIDDSTWTIRYLIITTGSWYNSQHVILSTKWLENISHSKSTVFTHMTRQAIKQSPPYSLGSLVTRDYESALHMHYKKHGYWIDERG